MICKRLIKLYHPNRAHLRAIVKRGFSPAKSRDFDLAHRIPFPAVLSCVGMPLLRNQRCCWHNSSQDGTSLSFFPRSKDGRWIFHCSKSECGITGDVVEFWYELVYHFGGFPSSWCRLQACADLLARAGSGEIDVRITEFEGESAKGGTHGRARGAAAPDVDRKIFAWWDGYYGRLDQLIRQNQGREIAGSMRLARADRIGVKDVMLELFPENRALMLTYQPRKFHPIKMRDVWLSGEYRGPTLDTCSHVSQNYRCRNDVDGASYAAFKGIARRWLVIEGDQGTLEQQFWLHKQLSRRYDNLGCLCWSGEKSLHGFYWVEGWSVEQCFDLYAEAISLGVNDHHTWLIFTQVRLPSGFNWKTRERQTVLVWNL